MRTGWVGTRSDHGGGFLGSSLGLSSDEALFSPLPIHDLHHLGEVLGTSVLVVEIVCVLPDVNRQQWYEVSALICYQVLVASLDILQLG